LLRRIESGALWSDSDGAKVAHLLGWSQSGALWSDLLGWSNFLGWSDFIERIKYR
jgi:hypothetical protein